MTGELHDESEGKYVRLVSKISVIGQAEVEQSCEWDEVDGVLQREPFEGTLRFSAKAGHQTTSLFIIHYSSPINDNHDHLKSQRTPLRNMQHFVGVQRAKHELNHACSTFSRLKDSVVSACARFKMSSGAVMSPSFVSLRVAC